MNCSFWCIFYSFLQLFLFQSLLQILFANFILLYPIIRKSNFPWFLFSDTWRVTSPEKEKEIPPLRVVSQSCVSLSLKKKSQSWNEKRLKIGFLIILEGMAWNITREIICTQLPSRTFRMMMHTLFYPLIYEQQIYSLIFSSKATKVFLSHILISLSLSLSLKFFLFSLHYQYFTWVIMPFSDSSLTNIQGLNDMIIKEMKLID